MPRVQEIRCRGSEWIVVSITRSATPFLEARRGDLGLLVHRPTPFRGKTQNGERKETSYFVYILTNKTGSVLYTGMTSDLPRRVIAHKQEYADGFTKKYKVNQLVYYELS